MNDLDRTQYMGSSDAAPSCGVSRFRTALDVYLFKRGEVSSVAETFPMRFGSWNEPLVLAEFERDTGLKVSDRQKHMRHRDHPHIGATVDGIADGAIVEAKTTSMHFDLLPDDILCQVQEQLAVANLKMAFVPVLFSGRDFRTFTVDADKDLQDTIISRMNELWARVQNGTPPSPVSIDDVNKLYPHDFGKAMVADEELFGFIDQLKSLKDETSDLSDKRAELELSIKERMGDHAVVTDDDGRHLATWKCSKESRRFDSKTFKSVYPSLYEEYSTAINGARRFLLK